jgi:hypothetical protein
MRQFVISSHARLGVILTALALGLAQTLGAQGLAPSALTQSEAPPNYRAMERAARGRIAMQVLVGVGAAAAVGLVAWSMVDDPEGAGRRVKGDAGYTPNANTAYAVGSFVGTALATYMVGRGDGSRASFGATALGAAIASIPIALGRHEPYLPLFGIVLGAPLQALGGTIGYQSTRREP